MRKIEIRACLNGFIVQVGCQTVVFASVDALVNNLAAYLRNPEMMEKDWLTKSINSRWLYGPVESPTQEGQAENRQGAGTPVGASNQTIAGSTAGRNYDMGFTPIAQGPDRENRQAAATGGSGQGIGIGVGIPIPRSADSMDIRDIVANEVGRQLQQRIDAGVAYDLNDFREGSVATAIRRQAEGLQRSQRQQAQAAGRVDRADESMPGGDDLRYLTQRDTR